MFWALPTRGQAFRCKSSHLLRRAVGFPLQSLTRAGLLAFSSPKIGFLRGMSFQIISTVWYIIALRGLALNFSNTQQTENSAGIFRSRREASNYL